MSFSGSYRRVYGGDSRPSGGYRSHSASRLPSYRSRGAGPGPETPLLTSAAAVDQLRLSRTSEKEQLQGLNDRFAGYIETVHSLEQRNRRLEAELLLLRQRQAEPRGRAALYQAELRELRGRLAALGHERSQALLERDGLEEELQVLQGRLELELRRREEAEAALRGCRKELEAATLARLELERKAEAVLEELGLVERLHREEVRELEAAAQAAAGAVEADAAAAAKPDLTAALRDIRTEYESLAARNAQAADDWYRDKFSDMSAAAARHCEALRANREELSEYRRQLQARSIEVESVRGAGLSLERQLEDMEERHSAERGAYQDNIAELEAELRTTKTEMARHLREYQDLLNVKMALDIEIAAYRKLLEGEETRFNTGPSLPLVNSLPPDLHSLPQTLPNTSPPSSHSLAGKEKDLPPKPAPKPAKPRGEAYEEIIEETIISTKKVEKAEPNNTLRAEKSNATK